MIMYPSDFKIIWQIFTKFGMKFMHPQAISWSPRTESGRPDV
jgi:hypothetical protein